MDKRAITDYFDSVAGQRMKWKKRNSYYHRQITKYYNFFIPENLRVLEIGCGAGDLLASVNPSYGVGIDFSPVSIEIARKRFPSLTFYVQDAENIRLTETFDYIILSDLVSSLWDIQAAFDNLKKVSHAQTRIIISFYNFLWEPVMRFGEFLHIKLKQPLQNWLSSKDIAALLSLSGIETIRIDKKILLPKNIPGISWFFNNFIANLPLINSLSLTNFVIAHPQPEHKKEYPVSVIIPAQNEKGNIEQVVLRTPVFGTRQEFIFIEGKSADGTFEEMIRIREKHSSKTIRVIKQSGKGKGNAVREGFDLAVGEILIILDADLSTPPEDMPKFYQALKEHKGEFINGCRLVYPMEKQAMRSLNLIANKFFGWFFTYLLGQRLKDTLCGTKALFKSDYERIKKNRSYFGDFDPFGDFDLLFGATKLNLKIVEVLVRYKERSYGSTQINRFRHGWLLLKMSFFAARKIKFI